MSSKYCNFLIVLIITQTWYVKGRIVDGNADGTTIESGSSKSNQLDLTSISRMQNFDSMSSVKELSDEEIQRMKIQLANELTPVQIDELGRILNKFKKGTTMKDHIEGMVELIVLAVAVKSNATDVDITKLFDDDIQTTTIDSVTLNHV